MALSINPWNINAILIEEEESILLVPYHQHTQDPTELRQHLITLAERVKKAAMLNYTYTNALPHQGALTSHATDVPTNIPSIESLMQKLKNWLNCHQSHFDQVFYEHISKTLNLGSPEPIQSPLLTTPSTSKAIIPRKRWLAAAQQEEMSILTKKTKSSVSENNMSSSSIEKIETISPSYFLKEITLLEDSIFILTEKKIADVENWITNSHQYIGTIITNFDFVCVDTRKNLNAPSYANLTTLRQFSLESLLNFMKEQEPYIKYIADAELKQVTQQSHLQLMADLQTAVQEIIESSSSHSTTSNSEEAIIISDSEEESSDSDTASKQQPPLEEKNNHYFISLRNNTHGFSLSGKKGISSGKIFQIFLNHVVEASSKPTFSCAPEIPSIQPPATNDFAATYRILYYIVHRNWYCWDKTCRTSQTIEELTKLVESTLNMLNNKYCLRLAIDPDPLSHHPDLLTSLVSKTNPPMPILTKKSLSYVSLHPHAKKNTILYVKQTSTLSPIHLGKKPLIAWIQSLKQHKKRIAKIIEESNSSPLHVKCYDESWPLSHNPSKPIPQSTLLSLLKRISQHNLKICLRYFKGNTDLGEPPLHAGYKETEELLSSTLTLVKNPDASLRSILHPIKNPSFTTSQYEFYFFSIFRPHNRYEIKVSKITLTQYFNAINSTIVRSKKITRILKKILSKKSTSTTIQVEYNREIIQDVSLLLEVLYHVVEYNLAAVKSIFSLQLSKLHALSFKKYYETALLELSSSQEFITKAHNEANNLPFSLLNDLQHPLKDVLLILYQQLKEKEEKLKRDPIPPLH
ncbi:hypothetical protein CLAVI_000907 [Candidatus Clavichlamydia salmonicola]|uniref:hypothetical protein n=1 Tax=Candidatus Clavichlamydia salmonicola TaxID=469812 RepID=UPI001890D1D4|nr:hypothetical protein [Candidatus Clavichlamydia salmonicola]MBF5051266.1 hypothetical protein [Candidatus Clavichlamydia salmonicola]